MNQPLLDDSLVALPLPDFLPQRVRRACSGKRITFRIPAGVRERMQVPEEIDGAEWADRYHRVTAIDAAPGKWRSELVPHTRRALQLASAPHVRQLWLCWPERDAKTHVLLIAAKRTLDRGCESGNIFWLMPSEHEAKKAFGERVIESLKASPRTARLLSRLADDTTRTLVRFRHGPRLFAAWAGSAASVSSFFGKLNIGDEIDKAETTGVGKETDILTLLFKRGRDDDSSKFLFASTPAQGYIYSGTMGCQRVEQYHGRCPHCRKLVNPGEDHVIIPEGASVEDVSHGRAAVAMVCPSCAVEWTDPDRLQACQEGEWVAIKGAEVEYPETVGLHKTAYVAPKIPVKEIAAAILKARAGGETEKKALENGYNVRDYKAEQVGQIEEGHILKFRSELPRNLVPPDTARLALIVDPQQSAFNYEVWALGYAPQVSLHMVRHGVLDSFEDLDGLLAGEQEDARFYDHEGKQYKITCGLIDSGGTRRNWQKHSRTYEVYEWCSRNRIMTCLKGLFGRNGEMISYKVVTTFPGTNKPIPGGLKRVNVRVDVFKDDLERRLGKEADDPGALSFHSGIDESFAKHFTGETKDADDIWQHSKKSQRIDFWDCANYALVLREMLKLRIPKKQGEAAADKKPIPSQQPAARPLPGWFRNR